ncbi:hypothetical protein AMJ49_03635 [Parcubacteria bacterium DG_74_2]|nr:MAG: hypothetical protein AMJ49_03635 [Parcubacteria bacterium DG_74_2]
MKKAKILRKRYPKFVFEKYAWRISEKDLEISFKFKMGSDIKFNPKVVIKNVNKNQIKRVEDSVLNNLIFHLGLIELLSYWKTACPPEIEIRAGFLNGEQIKFWRDLILKGMGQFFYENRIDFTRPSFLKIKATADAVLIGYYKEKLENRILVPIGGGKDSIITLEILKNAKKNITCFSLSPTTATQKVMKIGGCKTPIIVQRKVDRKLLELNRKGFLNGHTPLSAYLAFLSILLAVIFDYKFITFSNERSSNEGNLKYLGKIINHQYSKSFDFEKRFREYSKEYLTKEVEYFSFLRPLYEIQISKLFRRYPKYFSSFISCNEAFKTYSGRREPIKTWCQKCPKCLFIFTALYPFLGKYRLFRIFKKNLFERIGFLPTMLRLIGEKKFKPFECVGTKKETLIAFYLSWRKEKRGKKPFLLRYFEKNILPKHPNLEKESKKIMNSWSDQHNLPKEFEKILKERVKY